MLDGDFGMPEIRIEPATSSPSPARGRVESESTREQSLGHIELSGHSVHGASGSQHERIIGVEDGRALGEPKSQRPVLGGRLCCVIHDQLAVTPCCESGGQAVVGVDLHRTN